MMSVDPQQATCCEYVHNRLHDGDVSKFTTGCMLVMSVGSQQAAR